MRFPKIALTITAICYALGAFVMGDLNFLNWAIEARATIAMVWVGGMIMAPMFTSLTEGL